MNAITPIMANPARLDTAQQLAVTLLSERGDAYGAAIAGELHQALQALDPDSRLGFYRFIAAAFEPDQPSLRAAAELYLANATPGAAAALAQAAEPPRQELLRRMNMAPGGTAALIAMRSDIAAHLRDEPDLKPLDADLRHLLGSWFNRGFLELRRIDWQSPAAVLEKLITYEAVHEIKGWADLRRRLAPDRRCFAFFHPALPGEPLIFVEVALVEGLAASVQPLLALDTDPAAATIRAARADTAIFYSISNCQSGLRGVSFGNFLIKQVVAELQAEFRHLTQFSTLSPIPGFRQWVVQQKSALPSVADDETWWREPAKCESLRPVLMRLCAEYLTRRQTSGTRIDPVAHFHLNNGARLERINWLGNDAPDAIQSSFGIMVNYLYDHDSIERNHEAFAHGGTIMRSAAVDALLDD